MSHRRPTPTTPWDIAITSFTADDVDPDHAEISIASSHHNLEAYTFAQTLAGYRWCAGILGRLAITLAAPLAAARQHHGCKYDPKSGHLGCHITGDLTDLTNDMGDPPAIYLYVPTWRHDELKDHTKKELNKILSAEAWQPSAEDESEWNGPNVSRLDIRRNAS